MRKLAATQARRATGGSDGWRTPASILERVRRIAPIDLDPATSADNPVGAARFFVGGKQNGLRESWDADEEDPTKTGLTFVNAPYSQMAAGRHPPPRFLRRSVTTVPAPGRSKARWPASGGRCVCDFPPSRIAAVRQRFNARRRLRCRWSD